MALTKPEIIKAYCCNLDHDYSGEVVAGETTLKFHIEADAPSKKEITKFILYADGAKITEVSESQIKKNTVSITWIKWNGQYYTDSLTYSPTVANTNGITLSVIAVDNDGNQSDSVNISTKSPIGVDRISSNPLLIYDKPTSPIINYIIAEINTSNNPVITANWVNSRVGNTNVTKSATLQYSTDSGATWKNVTNGNIRNGVPCELSGFTITAGVGYIFKLTVTDSYDNVSELVSQTLAAQITAIDFIPPTEGKSGTIKVFHDTEVDKVTVNNELLAPFSNLSGTKVIGNREIFGKYKLLGDEGLDTITNTGIYIQLNNSTVLSPPTDWSVAQYPTGAKNQHGIMEVISVLYANSKRKIIQRYTVLNNKYYLYVRYSDDGSTWGAWKRYYLPEEDIVNNLNTLAGKKDTLTTLADNSTVLNTLAGKSTSLTNLANKETELIDLANKKDSILAGNSGSNIYMATARIPDNIEISCTSSQFYNIKLENLIQKPPKILMTKGKYMLCGQNMRITILGSLRINPLGVKAGDVYTVRVIAGIGNGGSKHDDLVTSAENSVYASQTGFDPYLFSDYGTFQANEDGQEVTIPIPPSCMRVNTNTCIWVEVRCNNDRTIKFRKGDCSITIIYSLE